jgi:hypothetical protein
MEPLWRLFVEDLGVTAKKDCQKMGRTEENAIFFDSFIAVTPILLLVLLHHQLVSRTRGCLQHLGGGGIDFDFLSQAMHELLEQLTIARAFVSPHLHQQSIGTDGVARICDQHLQ